MTDAKTERINVWKQVLEDFRGKPHVESMRHVGLSLEEYVMHPKRFEKTEVEILQKDCVYAAIDNVRLGMKPLLLNMASEFKAGGGVRNGSSAQEEELFRRSDYFRFLHPKYYPLEELCAVLSEGVLFYRLGSSENYELMKFPTKIDCVAAAAIRRPPVTKTGNRFARKEDSDLFKNKIRMVFDTAYRHGNDCLILSAWGCGAFGCPTEHVARLFREVVEENNGKFKKVVFAIFDNENFRRFKSEYVGSD